MLSLDLIQNGDGVWTMEEEEALVLDSLVDGNGSWGTWALRLL
jgi:hypothetical protein